jgi:hypothetical protein
MPSVSWLKLANQWAQDASGDAEHWLWPDFPDSVQVTIKNWKDAGIDAELKMKEYVAFISTTIYGKFDHMYLGLRGAWVDPEAYFYRPTCPANRSMSSG